MKFLFFLFAMLSASVSLQVMAAPNNINSSMSNQKQVSSFSALQWLQNMQLAYKTLNYEFIYIHSVDSPLDPKQLFHGVIDEESVTYLRFLNGQIRESLQFDDVISYYEQGKQPYSLTIKRKQHAFATLAGTDLHRTSPFYDYIILGKGRIADKEAIAIRMNSEDKYRYSYIIWLDIDSYLPLRLDVVDDAFAMIEQTMVLSLTVTEDLNPWVMQVSKQKRPDILPLTGRPLAMDTRWKLEWLPSGFQVIKSDQHKLLMQQADPVSYTMISDGMVSASIYISKQRAPMAGTQKIIHHGATLLYTEHKKDIEVNIIGDIPVETAATIAARIRAL